MSETPRFQHLSAPGADAIDVTPRIGSPLSGSERAEKALQLLTEASVVECADFPTTPSDDETARRIAFENALEEANRRWGALFKRLAE